MRSVAVAVIALVSAPVYAFTLDEAKADAKSCIDQRSNEQCKTDLSKKYGAAQETASHMTWANLPSDQAGQCVRIQLLKGTKTVQAGTPRLVPCKK